MYGQGEWAGRGLVGAQRDLPCNNRMPTGQSSPCCNTSLPPHSLLVPRISPPPTPTERCVWLTRRRSPLHRGRRGWGRSRWAAPGCWSVGTRFGWVRSCLCCPSALQGRRSRGCGRSQSCGPPACPPPGEQREVGQLRIRVLASPKGATCRSPQAAGHPHLAAAAPAACCPLHNVGAAHLPRARSRAHPSRCLRGCPPRWRCWPTGTRAGSGSCPWPRTWLQGPGMGPGRARGV